MLSVILHKIPRRREKCMWRSRCLDEYHGYFPSYCCMLSIGEVMEGTGHGVEKLGEGLV